MVDLVAMISCKQTLQATLIVGQAGSQAMGNWLTCPQPESGVGSDAPPQWLEHHTAPFEPSHKPPVWC